MALEAEPGGFAASLEEQERKKGVGDACRPWQGTRCAGGRGGRAVDLGRLSGIHMGPAGLSCPQSSQGHRSSRGRHAWGQGRHTFGGPQQSDGIYGWGHHGVSVPREGERLEA